jgi:Cdc6-like AAA superfamily ATPase
LEEARLQRQKAYSAELQRVQDEIDHNRREIKYMQEEEADKKNLAEQTAQAETLKRTAQNMKAAKKKSDQPTAGASQGTTKGPSPSWLDLPSSAKDDWMSLKAEGAQNASLDKLIQMIGLEEVKQSFLEVKSIVDLAVRQDTSLNSERFSCSLLGNPGTGKTTVARLYAEFLGSAGVLPGACFKETTGSALSNNGVSGCQAIIDDILNEGGGVLFIDEAYQMTSGNSAGGKAVLDYLLPEVENLTGKVVFVLAGYNKEMESFFAHNPGLPSRFPITMNFADYTDQELLHIFQLKIHNKYRGVMKCEDGIGGLYCRIVAARIGRGRGQQGFGNARTVENVLAKVVRRQATRLRKGRKAKKPLDDFLFTKNDLIGPEPSNALQNSKGWTELQQLIGLGSVKQSVKVLVDTMQQNYIRELAEQPIIEYSLNKVFLGNPGTGKTTIAKLYGSILVDLGLLSRNEGECCTNTIVVSSLTTLNSCDQKPFRFRGRISRSL